MKHFLLGIMTGFALLILGSMLYLRLGLAEIRADLPPSRFENRLMTAAVYASARREAPEMPNPFAPTDENLIAGGKLFSNGCAGCHGAFGSSEDNSDSLFPRVPQLHKGHGMYRGSDLLDRQAWYSSHRHVYQWKVVPGQRFVDRSCVREAHAQSASRCAKGTRTEKGQRAKVGLRLCVSTSRTTAGSPVLSGYLLFPQFVSRSNAVQCKTTNLVLAYH
jgi:hypothetical protein